MRSLGLVAALHLGLIGLAAGETAPASLADARTRCVRPARECGRCTVRAFKQLVDVGGKRYYYAANAPADAYCPLTHVLFEGRPGSPEVRPVWIHTGGEPVEAGGARIIRNAHGLLLQVPVRFSGTGHAHQDALLIWRGDRWHEVDTATWLTELTARLPRLHQIWKGVYPEYQTMRVETALWLDGDANCCPTGGTASATLGVSGDRLTIEQFEYRPSDEPGGRAPETLGEESSPAGLVLPKGTYVVYGTAPQPRLLVAPVDLRVGDVVCAKQAAVSLNPAGRLGACTLALEQDVAGVHLPGGTVVVLRDDGRLGIVRLSQDSVVLGLRFAKMTPDGTRSLLFRDGAVESGELAEPQIVHGVPCRGWIRFHPSGAIQEATLDQDAAVDGVRLPRGSGFWTYPSGRLAGAVPGADTRVGGLLAQLGRRLEFWESGQVKTLTLAEAATIAARRVAKGTVVRFDQTGARIVH